MKIILSIVLLSVAHAQNLTPEEQKKLIEENQHLKSELMKSKEVPSAAEAQKIMKALEKGRSYQEESNKALEGLDKED
jgi:hypothetical protein